MKNSIKTCEKGQENLMVADVWIVWYSARQEGVRFEGVGKQGVYRIPVMLALLIGIWQFCTKKAITFMSKLKMTSAKWFLKNRYSSKKLLSQKNVFQKLDACARTHMPLSSCKASSTLQKMSLDRSEETPQGKLINVERMKAFNIILGN